MLTNFLIEVDGTDATCNCYMAAHHHLVPGDLREMHSIGGYYVQNLRRAAAV